jgi:TRAP-type mannitol/chloroaromatic compound transport system permease small subunit
MKFFKAVTKVIDRIVKIVGVAAAYLSIAIMLLMVFEVISRRIFHSPTIWDYETVTFLFGGMIMLTLPYGLQLGVNVRVDVLYNKFSSRTKALVDIITFIIFFGAFMVIFTEAGYRYAIKSITTLERSWSSWSPLLWPVKVTIPICGTLMLLQGLSELIKMFFVLFGKGDYLGLKTEGGEAEEVAVEAAEAVKEFEKESSETKTKEIVDDNSNEGGDE